MLKANAMSCQRLEGSILWIAILLALLVYVDASQAAGQETLVGIVGKDFVLLGADSSVSQGLALTASNLDKIAPLVEPFLASDDTTTNSERHPSHFQQPIVAAAAGDAALTDRVVGQLQAYSAIHEYDAGIGCDVKTINCNPEIPDSIVEPGLNVKAVAAYARSMLSSNRPNLNVCLLIAGMMEADRDEDNLPYVSNQVQNQVKFARGDTSGTFVKSKEKETTSSASTREVGLQPRLYWLDELGSMQKIKYGAHGYGSNFCLSILDQGYKEDMTREEAALLMRDCFQQLRTRYVINSPQPPCIKCVDTTGVRLIR